MVRQVTRFICQKCGREFPKWAGQCPGCGDWNSLVETVVSVSKSKQNSRLRDGERAKPLNLSEVESKSFTRVKTGISELDRVLGGGMVPGSVVLVAGEPGMGKSTLLTQLGLELAKVKSQKSKVKSKEKQFFTVLYVCGEESAAQVKMRTGRLTASSHVRGRAGKQQAASNLFLLPEINVENIVSFIESKGEKQGLVIIDSIQTLFSGRLSGVAGSVGQIRECAQQLIRLAKSTDISMFIVGHVTKEGTIAGPKILEHMVDTVLYLEGDQSHEFRILRAIKNRFGSTDEVGIFLMRDNGMEEVVNPSDVFLSERQKGVAGSCVVVSMQGARPVLTEIQALVNPTSINIPRRLGTGIDLKRLQVLCATLSKRAGLKLSDKDVYVNVAGGLNLREPAVDLGICLAIISSYKNKPLGSKVVAIGEVGLLGEIRKVSFWDRRVKEAKSQGFGQIIGPDKFKSIGEVIKDLR